MKWRTGTNGEEMLGGALGLLGQVIVGVVGLADATEEDRDNA